MLCKVLVSLDLSNMYVSLTILRTFSEKEIRERKMTSNWECLYLFSLQLTWGSYFLLELMEFISDCPEAERINGGVNGY